MTDQHSSDRPDLTRKYSCDALEHITECEVCEPCSLPGGGDVATDKLSAPAHPLNTLVTQLNERWRIIDDPLQWILQRRKGNPRKKNSGWRARSFCRTREGLLRCVREYCGSVDTNVVKTLEALPDFHFDREKPQ